MQAPLTVGDASETDRNVPGGNRAGETKKGRKTIVVERKRSKFGGKVATAGDTGADDKEEKVVMARGGSSGHDGAGSPWKEGGTASKGSEASRR